MKRDLVKFNLQSSFLSCEKDAETILRRLFIESRPYSDILKKLLIINTKDCLDNKSQIYQKTIDDMSISQMREQGYIKLEPKIRFPEHEEIKSYILLDFDNFIETDNPEFRDCTVSFHVICHTDYWDIGNYRLRPLKICGYIDAILNKSKLSGIGILNFLGCSQLTLSEDLAGYVLMYQAAHGSDDIIPPKEVE